MSRVGEPSAWECAFPDDLIPEVIELLHATWQGLTPKAGPKELEVPLTKRFRRALVRSKNARQLPFLVLRELPEDGPDDDSEEGRHDLVFIHGHREDVYLAFECKRLRIPRKHGTDANYDEYIGNDGMMCFVTGKYAEGLPHGGMIGYVMDGEVQSAVCGVWTAIQSNAEELKLPDGEIGFRVSRYATAGREVQETSHILPTRDFTILHVFLPCSLVP